MLTIDFSTIWRTHQKNFQLRSSTVKNMKRKKIAENGSCHVYYRRLPSVSHVTRCASGVKKLESILCVSGVTCMVLRSVSVGSCSTLESDSMHVFHWPLSSAGRRTWVPTSTSRSYGGKSSRMWCDSSFVSAVGSIASCLPCTELPGPPDQTKLAGWDIRPSKVMRYRGEVHALRDGVTKFYVGLRIIRSET